MSLVYIVCAFVFLLSIQAIGTGKSAQFGLGYRSSDEKLHIHNITFEQRYEENLTSPSSCIPSSGNILKNLSTDAKSSACTASSNF